MSWFSDRTGLHLGNIGAPIGAVLGSFVGMPTAGAALGQGIGALGQGKSIPQAIGQGAATYGVGKVLGPLVRAIPGIGSVLGGGASASPGGSEGPYIPGGAGDVGQLPGSGSSGVPWEQILSAATGGGGSQGGSGGGSGGIDWGSILGNVGGFVKDNGLDLAMAGLATAQGVNAAKASQRAGGFQDKAINLAEQNWAAGAPLRSAGTTRLLAPKAANLSSVYTNPANPFATPYANPSARVRRMA